MNEKRVLVLGFGYTGSFLQKWIHHYHPQWEVITTSRKGSPHIVFDFMDSSTWNLLPQAERTFWLFPAAPETLVRDFYSKHKVKFGKLVVMGSTSALKKQNGSDWVSEDSPLDFSSERVLGEEFLRTQGAKIVLSAGIYGPQRNPLNWIAQGRIWKSDKYVNMVHVLDLCQFLWNAQEFGTDSSRYIASDGNPQRWRDIIEQWEKKSWLKNTREIPNPSPSKRVNAQRSIAELKIDLRFPNFIELKVEKTFEV